MKIDEKLAETILKHVSKKNYRPQKPRKIAKDLGFQHDDVREVKRAIKHLIGTGKLAYGSNHLVGLPDKVAPDRVVGTFRRMQDGYGFVRPLSAAGSSDRDKDIYITAKNAGDAASGDKVSVKLGPKQYGRGGPRKEGRIVEVLERETHQFVGTYSESADFGFVKVDGKLFTTAIQVGDAGAKSARVDDKVVFEMVRFPSHTHEGEGVILEVLGARGDPGVDTLSIIHEYNLPGEFAEDALDEARRQADEFDESIGEDRRDLTAETVITIDPWDARDFDDAISLEKIENDHWRLGVHIADVSHFVQPRTPLDREARNRATSVYLPDQVIPMIPEIISNNLASLQPNKVRYTKTVFIEFTPDGKRVAVDACAGAIKSKHRFDYKEIDDYLAHPEKWEKKLTKKVHSLVGRMHTLAMVLRRRRFTNGSLELSMPEVKIDLDKDGRVSGAHLVEHSESHQIIEEFMLAANEAVAELFDDADWLFLRRVHAPPDPRKLKLLNEFVQELGFESDGLESRFAIQKLLNQVEGAPEQRAVNYAVLRSMKKAVYSPEEEVHYALASENYCHFTSPIRRYPDLTVHRLLDDRFRRKTPRQKFEEIANLGDHCSQREQRAAEAERELIKVKLLEYLSDRIGEEFDAVVTGVQEFGLFAQGLELPAEGLVHISSLGDDYYRYDARTHTLAGNRSGNQYRLGDFVRVAVARVDIDRRELDFKLVSRLADRRKTHKKSKPSSRRPKSSSKHTKHRDTAKKSGHAKGKKTAAKGRGTKGKGGKGKGKVSAGKKKKTGHKKASTTKKKGKGGRKRSKRRGN